MTYARINLEHTFYEQLPETVAAKIYSPNYEELQHIYTQYCRHKKFKSVMPIFQSEFKDINNDIIGYYDNEKLVAFSLIKIYDSENVEAIQFAWDYYNPTLALGIKSLKHECAYYKEHGYKYLYLGGADEYKSKLDGFEILGPL